MNEFITLTELSKETGVGRSMLHHFRYRGLITEDGIVGKMTVFNKENALLKVRNIKKLQDKGYNLAQITNDYENLCRSEHLL